MTTTCDDHSNGPALRDWGVMLQNWRPSYNGCKRTRAARAQDDPTRDARVDSR